MKITIRQIEAFAAAAELGSFSRAAERLCVSQPTLSQVIRDLELALDQRLFDRTTRRVDLTEAGRAFATQAVPGLEQIARGVAHVQDLGALRTGLVRIAAPPLLAATAVPHVMEHLQRAHPGLSIRIVDLGTDVILSQIQTGQADLGLGTFPPGDDTLERVAVTQDKLMLFVHGSSTLTQTTWSQLADAPLITLTRESGIRLLTEVGFEAAQTPLRPAHEVHQVGTALALVAAGQGQAVLPAYARAAVGARPIRAIHLHNPEIVRDITLITARHRALSPATLAVRDTLRHALVKIMG